MRWYNDPGKLVTVTVGALAGVLLGVAAVLTLVMAGGDGYPADLEDWRNGVGAAGGVLLCVCAIAWPHAFEPVGSEEPAREQRG